MGQSDCSAMRRPILDIQHLKKYFPVTSGVFMRRTGNVHAVDDISFSVFKGETLGIVGESGCGKSTLGRCIMGLYPLTQGRILLDGKPLSAMTRKMRKIFSTRAQMIFQDPFESLNPRQTVRQILEEKFRIHGVSQQETAMQIELLLDQVGLDPGALTKYPHEFSGGQRQRIGVARAISMTPQIVICDEPVSALDVSVQSKILNLLLDLQSAMGLTYLFISHDLSVVRHMSDRIIVMYLGRIMEIANAQNIYNHPTHPYTKALLEAVPVADPDRPSKRTPLQGEIPSAEHPPPGCRFSSRCPVARSLCFEKAPTLSVCSHDPGHLTACHYPLSD
ncbi:ABC transporter ATP-binding protein [Desulfobacter sp.]|uniref:ABC transporter ATP-binding protein n=1 Tax=Desulfobacter sp. TaxID=2294 RepID=UPI001B3EADE5|nr:ABC transporter ATP-binding protein [Desulfobacter sp.]MBP8829292.1 ABC transporter ATP-binding protein [Desulfobacter sp.]MBP9598181.1 ABC transporter ATP-binding protein [Desulfobacter sp.]